MIDKIRFGTLINKKAMKKFNYSFFLLLALFLFSCERTPNNEKPLVTEGVLILNNGTMGGNNANIGIYDLTSKSLIANAFYAVNNQSLGELGQDVINFGEDIYIAVGGSQTIFVTDFSLKIKKQINAETQSGIRLSPMAFAVGESKVYISYYEGYVGEIDPVDYAVKLCQVGPNPEGLAVAGDKLYVANSGGMNYPIYNNTVSIVSLPTFTETTTIEVNVNPIKVVSSSDGSYVYVSSYGNYGDAPVKLQMIEVATNKVSDLAYYSISSFAKGEGDVLYVLCAGYDEDFQPLPGTVYKHDMTKNKPLGAFISDGTTLPNAYSISVAGDYVYIGCSDYKNTGDVYVFTSEGKLYDKFDSQGVNPLLCFAP